MKLLERLMYHPNLIKRTFFVLWAGGFIPIAGITVVLWLVSQFR